MLHVCTKTNIQFLSKNICLKRCDCTLGNNDHNLIASNGMMRQGLLMKSIFTYLTATNVHELQSFSSATTGLENIIITLLYLANWEKRKPQELCRRHYYKLKNKSNHNSQCLYNCNSSDINWPVEETHWIFDSAFKNWNKFDFYLKKLSVFYIRWSKNIGGSVCTLACK